LGWLSDALGRRLTIGSISFGGLAVALIGYKVGGDGLIAKYLASFLVGALIFPIYAISAAHTNDAIAPKNRVSAAAGLVLLFGVGSIFGPLLSGAAMSLVGSEGYYVVLAATMVLSLAAAAATR